MEYKVNFENGIITSVQIVTKEMPNMSKTGEWFKNSNLRIEGYYIVSANSEFEARNKAQIFADNL